MFTYRLHLTQNLRSLAFLLVALGIVAAVAGLWWANYTGMPESWRVAIERTVSRQGANIKIGALSYLPYKGVIASDVRVYSEPEHLHEISRLERVVLDFDKTRLASGILHLNKIQLDDAKLDLAVDPENPDSEILSVTDATGTIFMPGDKRLEIRDAVGKISGINVSLDAQIIGYQGPKKTPPDPNIHKRRELLAKMIKEIGKWHFDTKSPPTLRIVVEGDVNERSSITARFGLDVINMEKNGHSLAEFSAKAELAGDLLTLTSLRAKDVRGVLDVHADYDILAREGRFDVTSTLEVPQLLTAWLGLKTPRGISAGGKQMLEGQGTFRLPEALPPVVQMTGHARCESMLINGTTFDVVESSFSLRDGNVFLRDLSLQRPDGRADGKVMIEHPVVRLKMKSTLPVSVYRPFVVGQPLEMVLKEFTEFPNSSLAIDFEGSFDLTDRFAWGYAGTGIAKNLAYRGVPLIEASSRYSLNHHELDFQDGTVAFNYSKYALRDAFDGPNSGTAKVGRIRYDAPNKTVEVDNVQGLIWAAPLVRLFAPKVADTLESYRFHTPPEMRGSGIVDVTPQGRTDLEISFKTENAADYVFLGENLTLSKPRATVNIRGPRVTVEGLQLEVFGGPVVSRFDYLGEGRLTGDLNWTGIALPALTSAYGFQMKGNGNTTGRIDFALTDGKVETMQGAGLIALENAELFSVPMFGPLTPMIGEVLNDERAGFERAKNAFCSFQIDQGILRSSDFKTSTRSLDFSGDGLVNLKDRSIDLIIRMNARGLLGLLTLPLRPFSGLFQFHGTGPLREPKWEKMKFTAPAEADEEPPKAIPRAEIISAPE